MPRKIFVAGEILTAADVNTNLMDQAVMVFADSAARGSAIPSPSEGMLTYLSDVNALEVYTGAAFVPAASGATLGSGSILQVVQTLKTDTFTTTSDTFVTVTGAEATITPRSASSKILILGTMFVGTDIGSGTSGRSAYVRVAGGNSAAYVGDAASNRVQAVGTVGSSSSTYNTSVANGFTSLAYLDSPATTSAVTYSIELRRGVSGNVFVGRTGLDSDSAAFGRFPTTIILMEVAG